MLVGRWGARTLVSSLAFFALVSCGQATPDFDVRGTGVVVRSDAPFTRHADFAARVESTVDAALKYWGGNWSDLAGKNLVFEGGQHVECNGADNAIGCYDGEIRVSTQDAGVTLPCVEETVLVHEVGHAIIGDPNHEDPRWMDFSPVTQDLQGRQGYDVNGESACPIFVNMWRHPPQS